VLDGTTVTGTNPAPIWYTVLFSTDADAVDLKVLSVGVGSKPIFTRVSVRVDATGHI
jgi:hypothetical protein